MPAQRAPSRQYGQSTARARRFHHVQLSSPPSNHEDHPTGSSPNKTRFQDLSPPIPSPSAKRKPHSPTSDPDSSEKSEELQSDQQGNPEGSEESDQQRNLSLSSLRSRRSTNHPKLYQEVDSDVDDSQHSQDDDDDQQDEFDLARFRKANGRVAAPKKKVSSALPLLDRRAIAQRNKNSLIQNLDSQKRTGGKGKARARKATVERESQGESDQEQSEWKDEPSPLSRSKTRVKSKRSPSKRSRENSEHSEDDEEEGGQEEETHSQRSSKVAKNVSSSNHLFGTNPEPSISAKKPAKKRKVNHSFSLIIYPRNESKKKSKAQSKWARLSLKEKEKSLGLISSPSSTSSSSSSALSTSSKDVHKMQGTRPFKKQKSSKLLLTDPSSSSSKSSHPTSPKSKSQSKSLDRSPPLVGSKQSNSALSSMIRIDSKDLPLQDSSPDPSPVLDPIYKPIAKISDSNTNKRNDELKAGNTGSSISSNKSVPLPSSVKKRNGWTPKNLNSTESSKQDEGQILTTKSKEQKLSSRGSNYILSSKPLPPGDYYARKKKEEASPTGKTLKVRKSLGLNDKIPPTTAAAAPSSNSNSIATSNSTSSSENPSRKISTVKNPESKIGSTHPNSASKMTDKIKSDSNSNSDPSSKSSSYPDGLKKSSLSNQIASASSSSSSSFKANDSKSNHPKSNPSASASGSLSTNPSTKSKPTTSQGLTNLETNTTTKVGAKKPLYQQLPYVKGTKKPDMRTLFGKGASAPATATAAAPVTGQKKGREGRLEGIKAGMRGKDGKLKAKKK